ncbi:hypothetical protein [Curtobacterium sp. Leaf261]|uniref:hypothetical protein n=1 Tax=Curtobacterium sp. Leaf261 TaxID=1736311 RepID=UPI000A9E7F6B|nr:hypothetical protein [Curtobacterium sp. Leaf261]
MNRVRNGIDGRRVVGVVVTGVVVGGLLWFFGLSVPQALMVVAAVIAVGVTFVALREDGPLGWPVEPVRSTPGARKDVQSLGWALRSRGGVPERVILRLRAVARRRLAAIGLDLDDPLDRDRIVMIVGAGPYDVLTRTTRPELDLGSFTAVLTAVEVIGSTSAGTADRTSTGTTDRTTAQIADRTAARTVERKP